VSISLTQLNIDEALRYMGCVPQRTDPATLRLTQECAAMMLAAVTPRWTHRVFGISFEEGGVRLDCGLLLPGEDLKVHLEGCEQVILFCATLGAGADGLIRRYESVDMAKALALDCCAAAAVEQVCDEVELELHRLFPEGHFPFRFSPGYGDLPLTLQSELLELLDAPRRVGLTASASHILLPRKSVTALLGVADRPVEREKRSCLSCPAQGNCSYRKAGGHCGIS